MKLFLNYDEWVCGNADSCEKIDGNYCGAGEALLLNDDGYYCCLGQWSKQLGCKDEELQGHGEPYELKQLIPPLNEKKKDEYDQPLNSFKTTSFASKCISINDDATITIKTKVQLLHAACKKEGIELILVNFPAGVLV